MLLIVVDYEICGAEKWQAKERHIIHIDLLETVDQDFDYRGVGWVFLSFSIDYDIWNNQLVIRDPYFESRGNREGEVALISRINVSDFYR